VIPTKTKSRWPLYLAGAAFLLFTVRDPEGSAHAIQYVAASLGQFVGAF
jgi:hypothetical protein